MADWLAYATRDPIPGVGPASFDYEASPTWKLLLHTTEGATYSSARGAYVNNGFAPNITVGPDPDNAGKVRAWQHLSFSSRSTTLADDPGGIRPNRDYVVQVEICGFADPKWNDHQLYIHNWPSWYKSGVAKVLRDMLAAKPIPRRSTVTWVDYPQSYGENAAQRLSASAFDAYAGILGHEHAPENRHGDPGNVRAFVRDYLLDLDVEEDMPVFRHYGVRTALAVPPVDSAGQAHPLTLTWDTEWADPPPVSHSLNGSSYARKTNDGWSVHELSGVRLTGLATGDNYQVQIVILNPPGDEITWSAVVHEGVAASGSEFFSTARSLRSRLLERVRWRIIYLGKERDVKVARAEWIIREY